MPDSLSSDQLRQLARYGAKARLEEIKTEIASIETLIGRSGGPAVYRRRKPSRKRRQLSASGRAAIAAAQKARWAKIKAGAKKDGTAGRRKRKAMSAAARRAVSARMKKYWAARRRVKKEE